jgi:putative intracellular protease/amidase
VKTCLPILAAFLLLVGQALAEPDKILVILTSHAKLGNTGRSTGFYLSEVTHPYEVFSKAGYTVDFMSPQGGDPPMDGVDKADEKSKELLHNAEFRAALAASKTPDQIRVEDYVAVFFAGGHGTMWDLPDNTDIQKITAEMYEQGGAVAAVCHGPVALVNVQLSDGSYLVDGQPMAAFTNEEEEAAGLTDVMPFLLETKLRQRGAKIEKAENFKKKVVVGDRLITGQNPASAAGVAEELVKLLRE